MCFYGAVTILDKLQFFFMANGTFRYTLEVGIIRNPPLNSEFYVKKELRQPRFQILYDTPFMSESWSWSDVCVIKKMHRQYCALTTTIALRISLFLLTNGMSSTWTWSHSQLQIPTTEVNGTHHESQSVREQKINSSVFRLKVLPSLPILPYCSPCPLPLSHSPGM